MNFAFKLPRIPSYNTFPEVNVYNYDNVDVFQERQHQRPHEATASLNSFITSSTLLTLQSTKLQSQIFLAKEIL